MQGYRRHVWVYSLLRHMAGYPVRKWLHFQTAPISALKGPYILVSNHNTDFDSILLGSAFPNHMYFVASEHIFRKGWLRRLLVFFLDPIPKRKGGADVSTAMQMIRRLRKGANIALFAEGNKSFHGVTCPVHPATGSLVKAAGVTLVTYKMEGGYFSSPRWSHTVRRGRMKGNLVAQYPAKTLAGMSVSEINRLIARDIHEDAYERQKESPVAFRGKRLAEGIGNALYLCPKCQAFGTITGRDDRVECGCGFSAAYTDMGMLTGNHLPFHTLKAWGEWQRTQLVERIRRAGNEPLFSDENQRMIRIDPDYHTEEVAFGTLSIGKGGLCCGTFHLPIAQLEGLEVYGRNTIVFSDGQGLRYQICSATERSGLKYFDAVTLLREERA
jgi:hypothetical protein